MSKQQKDKGASMEESLRKYFLDRGYYAVRGIKFKYNNFDITDIDLWLYNRPSSFTRERINVDLKNKKTPQAIERLFWTKGLQDVLKLDKCIVATTDRRGDVRDFGLEQGVTVLDGNFLSRIRNRVDNDRFSDEELINLINKDGLGKLSGDWSGMLERSKSRLISHLDYSGCNEWLIDLKYFIDEAIVNKARREQAVRLFYLMSSHFLIGLDFLLKDIIFLENKLKENSLEEGFTYGILGKELLDSLGSIVDKVSNSGTSFKKSLLEIYQSNSVDILKEYFSRNEVSGNLFKYAKELEHIAYSKKIIMPNDLANELQAFIAVILDYNDIPRRKYFDIR